MSCFTAVVCSIILLYHHMSPPECFVSTVGSDLCQNGNYKFILAQIFLLGHFILNATVLRHVV